MKQIEQLLIDEVPAIPLINQQYLALINERFHGVQWCENGCIDLKGAYCHE